MPHGNGNTLAQASTPDNPLDSLKHVRTNGTEYWSARELQRPLGYARWQRFHDSIERAKESAKNAGYDVDTHFVVRDPEKNNRVIPGRPVQVDYELTRFGAYLVVMNGDPRKPEIAAAQAYFAHQTRIAETSVAATVNALASMDAKLDALLVSSSAGPSAPRWSAVGPGDRAKSHPSQQDVIDLFDLAATRAIELGLDCSKTYACEGWCRLRGCPDPMAEIKTALGQFTKKVARANGIVATEKSASGWGDANRWEPALWIAGGWLLRQALETIGCVLDD